MWGKWEGQDPLGVIFFTSFCVCLCLKNTNFWKQTENFNEFTSKLRVWQFWTRNTKVHRLMWQLSDRTETPTTWLAATSPECSRNFPDACKFDTMSQEWDIYSVHLSLCASFTLWLWVRLWLLKRQSFNACVWQCIYIKQVQYCIWACLEEAANLLFYCTEVVYYAEMTEGKIDVTRM